MITVRSGCVHIRRSAAGFVMQTRRVLCEVRSESFYNVHLSAFIMEAHGGLYSVSNCTLHVV